MSNTLPLNIAVAALPPNVAWTPQQLAQAIADRLYITTQQTFALFVTGRTAPSSNVGPWFRNGNSWWVWSDASGAYVPITLDPESMRYDIGSVSPDPIDFDFWIETTVGGSPLALKIYYSGAWTDVYATQLSAYLTIASAAATYLTIANAAATYLTIASAAATYLTIAAAAAGYQPLNANLTTLTTSTLGDIIYSSAADTLAKLAGNTTANKRFLTQTGTGAVSAAPAWAAIVAGDIPDISATYHTVAAFNAAIASYSTTAQMNSAIAAAAFTSSPAKAVLSATQIVAIDGAVHKLLFASEVFDPNNVYDGANSRYVAPATGYYQVFSELQVDNNGGTASGMEIELTVYVNGVAVHTQAVSVASPPGSRWYPSVAALVAATSGQSIEMYMKANDGVNVGNLDISVASSFSVNRVPQS